MRRTRIDNRRTDQGADETRRLANDTEQREEQEISATRADFRNHGLRIRIPRADEDAVEDLVEPKLPLVVEAEFLGPDADHAPGVQDDDAERDGVEHGLRGELVTLLDRPEGPDAQGLGGDADEQEVGQLQSVEGDDFVLESADDSDRGVQGVAE